MLIEIGDVFRNEKEHESCLVIYADNLYDEGFKYKVLRLHGNEDSFRYHDLRWIPESILLGQYYKKIGHIDISLFRGTKRKEKLK